MNDRMTTQDRTEMTMWADALAILRLAEMATCEVAEDGGEADLSWEELDEMETLCEELTIAWADRHFDGVLEDAYDALSGLGMSL